MPILTDEQSRDVAQEYMDAANALTKQRVAKFSELSVEERTSMRAAEDRLRNMANMVLDLEITVEVENIQAEIEKIVKATKRGTAAIKKINDVKQALKIATSVIKLGAAAVTGNPSAIASALADLGTAVQEAKAA